MIQIGEYGEGIYVPKLSYVYPINMSIFNFFEVQNIPPKNKKNFYVKIFVKPLLKFLRIIRLCFYVRRKHIKHLNRTLPSGI